jgi:hypothetical protein
MLKQLFHHCGVALIGREMQRGPLVEALVVDIRNEILESLLIQESLYFIQIAVLACP